MARLHARPDSQWRVCLRSTSPSSSSLIQVSSTLTWQAEASPPHGQVVFSTLWVGVNFNTLSGRVVDGKEKKVLCFFAFFVGKVSCCVVLWWIVFQDVSLPAPPPAGEEGQGEKRRCDGNGVLKNASQGGIRFFLILGPSRLCKRNFWGAAGWEPHSCLLWTNLPNQDRWKINVSEESKEACLWACKIIGPQLPVQKSFLAKRLGEFWCRKTGHLINLCKRYFL